jgi:hypothetical protein
LKKFATSLLVEIAKKISRIDNSEIKTPFAQNRIEYILAKIAEVVRRE